MISGRQLATGTRFGVLIRAETKARCVHFRQPEFKLDGNRAIAQKSREDPLKGVFPEHFGSGAALA